MAEKPIPEKRPHPPHVLYLIGQVILRYNPVTDIIERRGVSVKGKGGSLDYMAPDTEIVIMVINPKKKKP